MREKHTESEKSIWNRKKLLGCIPNAFTAYTIYLDIVSGPVGETAMVKMMFAIKEYQINLFYKMLTKCFNSGKS